MKVVSIVGARPQFIKAAPVTKALREKHKDVLIHTGQHYDDNMSEIFFEQLGIPVPEYHLGVGSGSHGFQTGTMLARVEEVLFSEKPDWILVYGDTNSTLAGALAAAKMQIPVAHVEAGLRSYNRAMPEEINRVVADNLSTILLCPSQTAIDNLAAEGITQGVHLVGDVMADALAYAVSTAKNRSTILSNLGLAEKDFLLATVHRAENTDDPRRLRNIVRAFNELDEQIIFPLHPRTKKALEFLGDKFRSHIKLIEPLGYLDMVMLEMAARMILTDSGGIQKEAYWLSVPCITLRDETEWVETIECGWNMLTGADSEQIVEAVNSFVPSDNRSTLYGDGRTSQRIVALLERAINNG